jgi:hypothetical protein
VENVSEVSMSFIFALVCAADIRRVPTNVCTILYSMPAFCCCFLMLMLLLLVATTLKRNFWACVVFGVVGVSGLILVFCTLLFVKA